MRLGLVTYQLAKDWDLTMLKAIGRAVETVERNGGQYEQQVEAAGRPGVGRVQRRHGGGMHG